MMSAVALETPTASMPSQRMTKNTTAQMNDWTPWSMLGMRRCTEAILVQPGAPLPHHETSRNLHERAAGGA